MDRCNLDLWLTTKAQRFTTNIKIYIYNKWNKSKEHMWLICRTQVEWNITSLNPTVWTHPSRSLTFPIYRRRFSLHVEHHLPLGKRKGKCKNNFCRSSKVNRIIAYFTCLCVYVSDASLFSPCAWFLYHSLLYLRVCHVCVCVCGWEKLGGTEHKDTSEESHRQHPSNPPPSLPPSLSHPAPPPPLLQRWARTLAVDPAAAAAAEARLLFKAASSFGLFSLSLFFSADVNRVASQSSVSPSRTHTSFTKPQKRKRTNRRK